MDLSIFDNLGAEIVAFLASGSIITTAIVIVREIGLAKLRAVMGEKEVEIDLLNETIKNQQGELQAMRESQVAVVNSVGLIGQMVTKAYMNSKLDDNTKTAIAILYGDIEKEVQKAAVIGLDSVLDKMETSVQGMIENLPEGIAQDTANTMLEQATNVVEDLVSQVPDYLKDIVTGNGQN